ncbi:MAG: hypothetical protein J7L73_09710 [Anaerolineales bacterium]|nr:hypothetical protein [Anaerolineales bacterium]
MNCLKAGITAYNPFLFPYLLEHLQTCCSKGIPQHAEKILQTVSNQNKLAFIQILKKRIDILRPSQAKRVEKTIREAQAITR